MVELENILKKLKDLIIPYLADRTTYFKYWENKGKPIDKVEIANKTSYVYQLRIYEIDLKNSECVKDICDLLENKSLKDFCYHATDDPGKFRFFFDNKDLECLIQKFGLKPINEN